MASTSKFEVMCQVTINSIIVLEIEEVIRNITNTQVGIFSSDKSIDYAKYRYFKPQITFYSVMGLFLCFESTHPEGVYYSTIDNKHK